MKTHATLIDLDSPDYRPAVNALEWALHNARNLGYALPANFDLALRLIRGELKCPLYSDVAKGMAFGVITTGDDALEDADDMFEFFMAQTKMRIQRKRAAEAVVAFARTTESLFAPATAGLQAPTEA